MEETLSWCVNHPLTSYFVGAFLYAAANTIVKLSPTKADDIVVDIIGKGIKAGFDKISGR